MRIHRSVFLTAALCGTSSAQVEVNLSSKQVSHSLLRTREYLHDHQVSPAHRVVSAVAAKSDKEPNSDKEPKSNKEPKSAKRAKSDKRTKPNVPMCFIPAEDPSSCHNISVTESSIAEHLKQGDLLGDCISGCESFCADKAATSCPDGEPNKCTCCGCEKACFVGKRAECANGMVTVCHFHEDDTYGSLCIREVDVHSHLAGNENDYYGKCVQDIFIEKSVMMDLPPVQGVEDHGLYEIDYDVTYNEDGIIVLARSFDIIDGVICAPGSVEILFSTPLTQQSLASMFPEGAILVVDGRLFDTKCDVHPDRVRIEGERDMNVGFLVIQASHVEGSIVTVTGSATILDAIFEEQSMQYQMHPSQNGSRDLVSLDNIGGKFLYPPDGPLQVSFSVACSGYATLGDFKFTSHMVRSEGWLPVYLPAFEYAGEISYQMTAKVTKTLRVTQTKLDLLNEEFEPIGPFGIPGASFAFPSQIMKILDIPLVEPRAGLVIALPLTMKTELKMTYDLDLKSSATIDLGKTRVKVGLSYQPLRLIPLLPLYEKLESEDPHLINEEQPEQDDKPLSASAELSLKGQIGLEPQIRLDWMNLAWIGIGSFIGFELAAFLRDDPYPPTNKGSNSACSECHHIEVNGGLIVKDLFMKYKPFAFGGAKPENVKLVEFYLKWVWFTFCLSSSAARTLTCGNSCCAPTEVCDLSTVPHTCENAGCHTECCNDNQCDDPMICDKDGQCKCPYECCKDSDCLLTMPAKDICDMASHKCRKTEGAVDADSFRIVHIGDSYSAGTGAGQYANPPGCYRSIRNWGKLYRDSLPDVAATYVNRACNGAKMENYFNKFLLETTESPCRSPMQDEVFEDDGVTCKRYVEAQSKAITSDVDLVLMTFGGNDLNFGSIIEQCFVIALRDDETCEEYLVAAEASLRTGGFKAELIQVLRNIGQQLKKPGAKVVLSAYPQLLMDKEYILGDYDAGSAIRNLALVLDDVQQVAVDEANSLEGREFAFYFDKTKARFATHEPDPSVLAKNPDRWINEFFEPTITDKNEWYHPNVLGHQEWADALASYGTFDAISREQKTSTANNIDLAFVIDTTGSMGPYITSVKAEMKDIVNQISTTFQSYRVSIVTYKDYPSQGGESSDYPSQVDLDFTDVYYDIQDGINKLSAWGGGDTPETILSGLNAALDLEWRAGVTKAITLIGDAPAKIDVEGKEPGSGLTATQIIAKSESVDPVQIMVVNLQYVLAQPAVLDIVNGTGGSVESGSGGVVAAIKRILDKVSKQPFAWFGENIIARVGYPVLFDASGSIDPSGGKILLYEWDFDGDGIYDEWSNISTAVHAYKEPFEGFALLRVTSDGGVGFASARVIANEEGSIFQLRDEYCDWNATSGLPIIRDKDGKSLNCMINSTLWPTIDKPGVAEDYSAAIEACLEKLGSPDLVFQPCDIQVKMRIIHRQTLTGDYYGACGAIRDMGVNIDECVVMCQVLL